MLFENISDDPEDDHNKYIKCIVICTIGTDEAAYDDDRKKQHRGDGEHLREDRQTEVFHDEEENICNYESGKNRVYKFALCLKEQRTGCDIVHLETGQDDGSRVVAGNTECQQDDHCAAYRGVVGCLGGYDAVDFALSEGLRML